MRRNRYIVMKPGQALEDLDLWPGDSVLYGDEFNYLGFVNDEGVFVAFLNQLN